MEARFLEQRGDRNFLLQQHVALYGMESGPGFDRKTAERIFEPFFTTKSRGIGMGLAISRSLIEANGGQLWHDLDAESGAVIHFTLPLTALVEFEHPQLRIRLKSSLYLNDVNCARNGKI